MAKSLPGQLSELLDYARHCRFSAPGQENLL